MHQSVVCQALWTNWSSSNNAATFGKGGSFRGPGLYMQLPDFRRNPLTEVMVPYWLQRSCKTSRALTDVMTDIGTYWPNGGHLQLCNSWVFANLTVVYGLHNAYEHHKHLHTWLLLTVLLMDTVWRNFQPGPRPGLRPKPEIWRDQDRDHDQEWDKDLL